MSSAVANPTPIVYPGYINTTLLKITYLILRQLPVVFASMLPRVAAPMYIDPRCPRNSDDTSCITEQIHRGGKLKMNTKSGVVCNVRIHRDMDPIIAAV